MLAKITAATENQYILTNRTHEGGGGRGTREQ